VTQVTAPFFLWLSEMWIVDVGGDGIMVVVEVWLLFVEYEL